MPRRRVIPYDPRLRPLARKLRRTMGPAERRLWAHIRRGQVLGQTFYRQRPIDHYIVDFYAPDLGLVVEVDGFSHDEPGQFAADRRREQRLEALGLHVLRFRNEAVMKDLENVLRAIVGWIEDHDRRPEGF